MAVNDQPTLSPPHAQHVGVPFKLIESCTESATAVEHSDKRQRKTIMPALRSIELRIELLAFKN